MTDQLTQPERETKFRLVIEYDGTRYHGWQKQPEDPSIQAEIEKILKTLTQCDVHVAGSGRTDAGVHAIGQVAHFQCETCLSPEKFHDALNKMLPGDIIIRECTHAAIDFHARFSAKRKTYRYGILNSRNPVAIGRHYVWHVMKHLDVSLMQQAATLLVGEKDFKSFEGVGSPRKTTVRTIYRTSVYKDGDTVYFEVTGSGFLKFMVRNITGTLVEVGLGKISPEQFGEILAGRDRAKAGPTAPPYGLFLVNVNY